MEEEQQKKLFCSECKSELILKRVLFANDTIHFWIYCPICKKGSFQHQSKLLQEIFKNLPLTKSKNSKKKIPYLFNI